MVDQVGGELAAPVDGGHLYQQSSAPAGTYGAITLTHSLGSALGVSANATGGWALDSADSAELGNLVNNFTVMSWVFAPVSGVGDDWPRTIGDDQAAGSGRAGWNLGIRNKSTITNSIALTGNSIAGHYSVSGVTTNGAWQHIAATKSSTDGIKFYHNGVLVAGNTDYSGVTGDFNASSVAWAIGRANGAGNDSNINDLLMDEVRVYDNVLNTREIVGAAEAGQQVIPEPSSALLLSVFGAAGLFLRKRR